VTSAPEDVAGDPTETVIGVALPVPEPHGPVLQAWRREFGDPLGEVIPAHITLIPPTPVRVDLLPEVVEHLSKAATTTSPFRVRLRGTATFEPVSPVVFVVVAEGISNCETLAGMLRQGPLDITLSYPYHPHVTVVQNMPKPALDQAFDTLASFDASYQAESFGLYVHGLDGIWHKERDFWLEGSW